MERENNGKFLTGNQFGKGRPEGSQNKATKDLRQFFTDFVNDNRDKIKEDFDMLEPKDRLKFLSDIAKFVLPSLKSVEVSAPEINMTPEERATRIAHLKEKLLKDNL